MGKTPVILFFVTALLKTQKVYANNITAPMEPVK